MDLKAPLLTLGFQSVVIATSDRPVTMAALALVVMLAAIWSNSISADHTPEVGGQWISR